MKRLLIALALVALAAPVSAFAGGWATAGLAPPPDEVGAGDTWNARITILQHGQTPLEGVTPTVTIRNGPTVKSFKAKPTGEPGIYAAKVVFPSAGKWSYEVKDGFDLYGGGQTHTFAAVNIGAAGGGGLPFFAIIGIGGLALAAGFALFLLARRVRVRAPAHSH
ncbi:MAG: FixH family protein [Actinomycetota bacterium]|nr:FixH family protein [Actinomycetota bacterium]